MNDHLDRDAVIRALEDRVRKLEKTNAVLMQAAEDRSEAEHGAYDLFKTNATLEQKVGERTASLKLAQEQLQKSLSLVRATLDSTADGIVVVDPQGRVVDYNERFRVLWRIPQDLARAGLAFALLRHLGSQVVRGDSFVRRLSALAYEPSTQLEEEITCLDGRVFELYSTPQRMEGKTVGRVWCFRDITERKRTGELISRLGHILNSSSNEIYLFDAESLRFVQTNGSAQRNLGYSQDELREMQPSDIVVGLTPGQFRRLLRPLHAGREDELRLETELRRRDGTTYPVAMHLQLSQREDPAVFVAVVQDITERRRAHEQLHYLANYDGLTGLANRHQFGERLGELLQLARAKAAQVAVMFLDLDRFKSVNDTLGHSAGDRMLQEVARRIKWCLRGTDLVARLGGDEFAVALPGASQEAVDAVARKVLKAFHRPFVVDGQELYSATSIGISFFPADGEDVDTLLKHADAAMYLAKEQGRGNHQFFRSDLGVQAQDRLDFESRLRSAGERGELRLHYQGQFDLQTEAIVGFEALVRWEHPQLGLLGPDRFIPTAEETGSIVELGNWVLRTACRQWRAWVDAGHAPVQMAVNISVRQLRQPDFVDQVLRIVREAGMDPACLELELTETGLMTDADLSTGILERVKAQGMRVSIDDFGTGYSSLAYLNRFSIDTLKIDRSFVREIGSARDSTAIVQAISALGSAMRLTVVAEGVETPAQAEFLRAQGCHVAQGYLYSRPLPPDAATQLLQQRGRDGARSGR
ncbi:putative bifunctional diguanylate cyclase/phosphodiesterase [Caldimonas brevitalea]|uniref:Diguanylate cyclase n=1 Tax=Caldimonas brevitalea TaxID=413882 RepID=A0A0G3BFI6_9BURK|nr:EAL domain-containing protein [Caldimonas brevitalea]AKJ28209.1 diguanylate cyclase [Caldimonas brevitalea]